MMRDYKKLPPLALIRVYGTFSLDPGWYTEGDPDREPIAGEIVLHIDHRCAIWYKRWKLHREDGPAIEYRNGSHMWCIHGCKIEVRTVEQLQIELRKWRDGF